MKLASIIGTALVIAGCAAPNSELKFSVHIVPDKVADEKAREIALYFISHIPSYDLSRKPIYVSQCGEESSPIYGKCTYSVFHVTVDPLCWYVAPIVETCASNDECVFSQDKGFALWCE